MTAHIGHVKCAILVKLSIDSVHVFICKRYITYLANLGNKSFYNIEYWEA